MLGPPSLLKAMRTEINRAIWSREIGPDDAAEIHRLKMRMKQERGRIKPDVSISSFPRAGWSTWNSRPSTCSFWKGPTSRAGSAPHARPKPGARPRPGVSVPGMPVSGRGVRTAGPGFESPGTDLQPDRRRPVLPQKRSTGPAYPAATVRRCRWCAGPWRRRGNVPAGFRDGGQSCRGAERTGNGRRQYDDVELFRLSPFWPT